MIKKIHLHSVFKSSQLVLFLGLMLHNSAKAQESINSSGNDITGSGGSIAYSVGQVYFNSYSNSNGSVSQGVQQTYTINNIGINESDFEITLNAFPNPTSDFLTLQIDEVNSENLSYSIYDINGKTIENEQIHSEQTLINMSNLPSATYFVKVFNQENIIYQIFQIIKQ